MRRQLSQQEIDSYFQKSGSPKDTSPEAAVRFDFRRLDRIPKSQVSAIHHLHETFVRTVSSSLSVYLRSFVSGNLISVEQLPYSDFAEALPSPTCLVYLGMQPYEGQTLIEVNSSLVAPILDLMLGGDGKVTPEPNHELTDVENNLIESFFQVVVQDMHEIWKPIVNINFSVSSIETTPQMTGRFVPTEAVVAIAIELRIGESTGMINLAIPSITLKMMGPRFDQQWTVHKSANPTTELAIQQKLAQELNVQVECVLSGSSILLGDLLNLGPGDIFQGVPSMDKHMDVVVNGIPKFKATLVSEGKRFTALIE